MELKDIINFGYKYYLDENDNFREIINGNDINRTIDENFNNENLQKNGFFHFLIIIKNYMMMILIMIWVTTIKMR